MVKIKNKDLSAILSNIGAFMKVPAKRYWVDFDEAADVLYISFRKPQHASDSEMRDDGIIIRKSAGEVVGLTILDASKRSTGEKT